MYEKNKHVKTHRAVLDKNRIEACMTEQDKIIIERLKYWIHGHYRVAWDDLEIFETTATEVEIPIINMPDNFCVWVSDMSETFPPQSPIASLTIPDRSGVEHIRLEQFYDAISKRLFRWGYGVRTRVLAVNLT